MSSSNDEVKAITIKLWEIGTNHAMREGSNNKIQEWEEKNERKRGQRVSNL